jgi:hypothetical protein
MNVLERTVEKTVEHDAAGRITKITELHLTAGPDPERLLELEADAAMLHALEALARHTLDVLARPEILAKAKRAPVTMTIGPSGWHASYAVKAHALGKRMESSAVLKLLNATVQWPKLDIGIDAAPMAVDAIATPKPAALVASPHHLGFRAQKD